MKTEVVFVRKYFSVIFLLFVFLASILTTDQSVKVMKNMFHTAADSDKIEKKRYIIVIDPGHGGWDPGKVGINNALEKDINLSISFKLKNLLELNDIEVIMTRDEDVGLYSEADLNKKNADLNARVDIIKKNNADLAVSIHQNSFTEEYVKGAQVFFYEQSEKGKQLAQILQTQIVDTMADGNHRKAKSNSNYYMLKKTECPIVIVECGYMSNIREAALLCDENYQEKMAWAIHLGILQYINKVEEEN